MAIWNQLRLLFLPLALWGLSCQAADRPTLKTDLPTGEYYYLGKLGENHPQWLEIINTNKLPAQNPWINKGFRLSFPYDSEPMPVYMLASGKYRRMTGDKYSMPWSDLEIKEDGTVIFSTPKDTSAAVPFDPECGREYLKRWSKEISLK